MSSLLGERLGHLHGFADAGALNDEVVDLSVLGQPGNLLEQVATKSTANTAVLFAKHTKISK